MSPSREMMIGLSLAAAVLLSLTSPVAAKINLAATVMMPDAAPKYCSGAFRYAARVGNSDIAALSPVQIFANDRRFARTRYAARAMYGLEADRSRLHALTTMCGAR